MSNVAFADTNLFLRLFTKDDPDQVEAVLSLLRRAQDEQFELVTSVVAIAEMVWVMKSEYRLSCSEIRRRILSFTNTPGVQIESKELVIQAVNWYVLKNIDFVDAYNIAWMISQAIETAIPLTAAVFRG